MKNMKKLVSVLLTLVMALALTIPAFAATVVNGTDHTYDAYQIFAATSQNGDGGALGNITWGTGITFDAFLSALKGDDRCVVGGTNIFADCTSAMAVAEALSKNTSVAAAFADIAVEHLTTTKTSVGSSGSVDLALGYWLLVDTTTPGTGDAKNAALLQVINKGNLTIQKKYDVPTVEKTVSDNDVNIGDKVTFTLTATMPSRLDGYETYKVVFHDTLSKGLAYVGNLKVTIDGNDKTSSFTVTPETPAAQADGTTVFTVSCDDVLALGATVSSKIVVTYDAVLDSDAVIGTEGNPNKVYLEYSNDPNWKADSTTPEPTGNTPEKKAEVFTWKIPAAKVDGSNKPLAGAQFELYKSDNSTKVEVVGAAGVYTVCTKNDSPTDHSHVTTLDTAADGKLTVSGLEQGTYYLKETLAPAGYNLLTEMVKVTIGENGVITVGDSAEAKTEVSVINQAGTVLPETGGMGTTIFYVLGSILVLGAGVLLVSKKRMSSGK